MSSKNVGLREDVYERLKAHKRGGESFSDALERILSDVNTDWRTHAGFLSEEDADALEAAVERGMTDLDSALDDFGDDVDEQLGTPASDPESEDCA